MGGIKNAEKTKVRLQDAGEELLAYIQSTDSELREVHQSGEQNPQAGIYPDQIVGYVPQLILHLKKISPPRKKYLTK